MLSSHLGLSAGQAFPEKQDWMPDEALNQALLQKLRPLISRSRAAFLAKYAEHLRERFRGEQVEALQKRLGIYLDSLISGKPAEERLVPLREQMALAPQAASLGQAFVLSAIVSLISEGFQAQPADARSILSAFLQVFFSDTCRARMRYERELSLHPERHASALHQDWVEADPEREGLRDGFRSIFEHISSPVCSYDLQGRLLRWNKAFESHFHLENKEIAGKNVLQTMTQKAPSTRMKSLIASVFEGRSAPELSFRLKSAGGKLRYFSLSAFPVFNPSGTVSFGMAMVHDVTEKKELELALIRTEKMAAVGTLAAGLAHEIGTPLNVILGRAEAMLRATEEEQTAKGLMIVIEQVDRMTLLIERLLSFARRSPIERKQVILNRLILSGIEICEQRAAAKGITFAARLDPDLKNLWCDGDQILQVLVALFMNAVDAMPKGGQIQVQTQLMHLKSARSEQTGKSAMAQILVTDSGKGIRPEALDKIFDPFFTTKPVGKGTGLGLSVAHEIIRDHGGRIEVASTPGEGTTFCVCLPVEGGPSRAEQPTAP